MVNYKSIKKSKIAFKQSDPFLTWLPAEQYAMQMGWCCRTILAGTSVEVHLASEFAYHQPLLSQNHSSFSITSGETADSRQALVKVNEQNFPSLIITNVSGSTLSGSKLYFYYYMVVLKLPQLNKSYTAQIAVMAVLADALRASKGLEAPFDMNDS